MRTDEAAPLTKDAVEAIVGEPVGDLALYRLAFTHASRAFERGDPVSTGSYERLEFLGDAVIQLAVSDALVRRFPDASEGELTHWRAAAVRAHALAEAAARLELPRFAVLGRSEEATGGRRRRKLLTDLFESFVGALYLDRGWESARRFVQRELEETIAAAASRPPANARGQLQEILQREGPAPIEYVVVGEEGPPHRRRFTVEVRVEGRPLGRGEGASKKEAAQRAAAEALRLLGGGRPFPSFDSPDLSRRGR
ncbi:MAG: ribonuclease III [Firmicutes bacterium]|nr:ribonuclease III [Bacillota bacterium]